MIEIKGFHPRVFAAVQEWFKDHPVVELTILRDADMGSRLVRIDGGVCEDCGWQWTAGPIFVKALQDELNKLGEEMPAGHLPGDFIKSIRLNHAYDQQNRKDYCGGMMRLVTNPAGGISLRRSVLFKVLVVAVALVFGSVMMAPATEARACSATLVPSVNPSAVGQEVSFDVGCLKGGGNVVYIVGIGNVTTGEGLGQFEITGDFTFTFTEAGEYAMHFFQQRNGKQVLNIAFHTQVVE